MYGFFDRYFSSSYLIISKLFKLERYKRCLQFNLISSSVFCSFCNCSIMCIVHKTARKPPSLTTIEDHDDVVIKHKNTSHYSLFSDAQTERFIFLNIMVVLWVVKMLHFPSNFLIEMIKRLDLLINSKPVKCSEFYYFSPHQSALLTFLLFYFCFKIK